MLIAILTISISSIGVISASDNFDNSILVTVNNTNTGNKNIADYGEVKYCYGYGDKYISRVNKGKSIIETRPLNYEDDRIHKLDHIDLNSQGAGYNAEVNHIYTAFSYIKNCYPNSYDYKLYIDAAFYKAGKGYYNKVRRVKINFIDNFKKEHTLDSGDIEKKDYNMRKLFYNLLET